MDTYHSTMEKDSILHDGQTKPRSTHLTATTFVYTIKTLKQPGKVLFWHSHSIILK